MLVVDRDLVVTAARGTLLTRLGFRRAGAAVGRPLAAVVPAAWDAELAPLLVANDPRGATLRLPGEPGDPEHRARPQPPAVIETLLRPGARLPEG